MGWRIVLQPNGKFARFSEVVDNFTFYDATYEEALKECCEFLGRLESIAKVQRGIEAGVSRFEEALEIIEMVHGKEESDKYRNLLQR